MTVGTRLRLRLRANFRASAHRAFFLWILYRVSIYNAKNIMRNLSYLERLENRYSTYIYF